MKTHAQLPAAGVRAPAGPQPSAGIAAFATQPAAPAMGFRHDFGAVSVCAPAPRAAHTRQPIQRTLSLQGEREERDTNLARLNALMGESGGRVKHEDGRVVFDSRPGTREGKSHPGYRLLRRMAAHRHDVIIGTHPDTEDADPHTKVGVLGASSPGVGTEAFVHLPRVLPRGEVDVSRRHSNEYLLNDTPGHVQLGHELVHADHVQRGVMIPYDRTTDLRVSGTLRGHGAFDTTLKEQTEELFTIGVLRRKGPDGLDDISENQLRRSLGMRRRVAHGSIAHHLYMDNHAQNGKTIAEQQEMMALADAHKGRAAMSDRARQEAKERSVQARELERQHREGAANSLMLVGALRSIELTSDESRATRDKYVDAHLQTADQATETAEMYARAAAGHEAEHDRHRVEYRDHRNNESRAREAVKSKDAEHRVLRERAVHLNRMLPAGVARPAPEG